MAKLHPCYLHGCNGWRLAEGWRDRRRPKSSKVKSLYTANMQKCIDMQKCNARRRTAPRLAHPCRSRPLPPCPVAVARRPPCPPQSPWPARLAARRTTAAARGQGAARPWEDKSEAARGKPGAHWTRDDDGGRLDASPAVSGRRGGQGGRAGGAAGQGVCGRRGRDGRAVGRGGGGRRRGQAQEDVAIFVSARKRP